MDSDAIYRELGKAVVAFQWLDNQLRLVASFAISPETAGHAVREARKAWYASLVTLTRDVVSAYAARYGGLDSGRFFAQFADIFDRCAELGKRRNRLLHSAYVHIESFGELLAILRSDAHVTPDGRLELDQEELAESSFDDFVRDVAKAGVELGIIHRQLVAWYNPIPPVA